MRSISFIWTKPTAPRNLLAIIKYNSDNNLWGETKPGKGKKFFSLLISITFERLNYGCFQGVLFSKPNGGKCFKICEGWQEYSVDERSLQHWTTEMVSFLTYFVYSRIKMAVELSFKFTKVFRTLKLGKNYQVKV